MGSRGKREEREVGLIEDKDRDGTEDKRGAHCMLRAIVILELS